MKNFDKSTKLLERAKKVTPLGAQTYSKSYRYYCEGSAPSFIDYGVGSKVYDVDGNEYIDFVCGLGPITVGYNNEEVNQAVINQLNRGIAFSQQTEIEVLLAEKIIEVIPCAEMVRFVKNGSDATSSAVRLARAHTGKSMVLACGYHGMQDWYIGATANNKGIPCEVRELTKIFNYNDIDSLSELFQKYSGQIACVILEPIQGNGPKDDFLEKVMELTHKNDALLIFDEVVSGFRYALGGASEYYGINPDLVAFGKGMGNGLPISAVAGKSDIMKQIEQGVFVSTTFGGEALSLAGAFATINILQRPGTYEHIWTLGEQMKNGLKQLIDEYNVESVVSVSGLAPHCGLIFDGSENLNYLEINSLFSQGLIEKGILSVGINNISLSHTKEDIDAYLEGVKNGFEYIASAMKGEKIENLLKGQVIDPVFKRNIK